MANTSSQERRSGSAIRPVRLVIFILLLASLFAPWGTGWFEPQAITAGTPCQGTAFAGYCYSALTGWETFLSLALCSFGLLATPIGLLLLGGIITIWRRGSARWFQAALLAFVLAGLWVVTSEVAAAGLARAFRPIAIYWGGLVNFIVAGAGLGLEILNWRRAV